MLRIRWGPDPWKPAARKTGYLPGLGLVFDLTGLLLGCKSCGPMSTAAGAHAALISHVQLKLHRESKVRSTPRKATLGGGGIPPRLARAQKTGNSSELLVGEFHLELPTERSRDHD